MRNSAQKGYQLESKMQPASTNAFTKGQLGKQRKSDNFYERKDSSGSDEQRKNPVAIRNTTENGKIPSSVAYSKHMTTIQEKRRTLQRYKYINQLARLDYEQKMGEVYSKYTKLSKVTVMKKIMAKNQIAQFEDEDEDQNVGFDQLIQFKYGKDKSQSYHFQKEQINEYEFCEDCDTVHNDHPEVHDVICQKKRKEEPQLYSPYSDKYATQSLYRIKLVVEKIKSPEYQQLTNFLIELEKLGRPSKSIFSSGKSKILEGVRELKKTYYNDTIFVKIIAKTCYLIQKL